jgi:hypothetical protein
MGLWDNCVAAADVLAHLHKLGFVRDRSFDTESYIVLMSPPRIVFLKRPNAFGKIALIYVEAVYEDSGLDQPDWELVSCEY